MTLLAAMSASHVPVLADELIALLDPQPGDRVVDCTFGGGGHAQLVAERIGPAGELVAVDRDPVAADRFAELRDQLGCRARFVRGRFDAALEQLAGEGFAADAVYMDLGMSSLQLDSWPRGFSYAYDAPLDMRMDPDQALTAAEVCNEWDQRELRRIIQRYGEERHAQAIARQIVAHRPLTTTADLVEAIQAGTPPEARFGGGHPAKRTFQAIRIAVNDELGALDRALPRAWSLLRTGGRFAAIAFHSLEDRPVKRFLRRRAEGPEMPPNFPGERPPAEAELLARRAVRPTPEEADRNPRSRSARLRAARKLAGGHA